jgi:hypothetical protein
MLNDVDKRLVADAVNKLLLLVDSFSPEAYEAASDNIMEVVDRIAGRRAGVNRMQPIEVAADGMIRFKENAIVSYLLYAAPQKGIDLNHLVSVPPDFCRADWEQFYQLIGYSVSGYGDLHLVSDESKDAADALAAELAALGGK